MFNKKKKIIDKRLINSKNRFIVHLNLLKNSSVHVIESAIFNQSSYMVMFDSDMANTSYSATSQVVNELLEILKTQEIPYEINKYKVHYEQNILKNILSSKKGKKAFAYKIAFIVSTEHIMSFVNLFVNHQMNFRVGLNTLNNQQEALKFFTSNMISDENRFKYYATDMFYNHNLGRLAIFSANEEFSKNVIKNIKEEHHV